MCLCYRCTTCLYYRCITCRVLRLLSSVWIQALNDNSLINISAALANNTGASALIICIKLHLIEKVSNFIKSNLTCTYKLDLIQSDSTNLHIIIKFHDFLNPSQWQFLCLEIILKRMFIC